ncbi:APC family permease [Kordiimonas sp.]|uniref:APC family permease n=1 Tax=Kordiimonas sp. TaxID=1970157 RepID=UPI003A907A1B
MLVKEKKRVMGFWRTWGLSIGMMVGSGVFMLPTVLAPFGKYALLSWLVTGAGTVALAFSLAYMARRVTTSGGPYAYTRAGFGDFTGFLMAWGYWVSVWVSVAAVTVAFIGYLAEFIPSLRSSSSASLACGLALIWVLVIINCRSVRGSSAFQLVTSLAKFLPLLFLALFGLVSVESANYANMIEPVSPLSATAAASALAMWAFIGFEVCTIPAGEVQDPAHTIPRATMAGVLAVVVLYLAVTVAAFGLLPAEQLMHSTAPLADAASALVGPVGATIVAVIALIATGSGVNANVFAVGQMPMAAALDGLFPSPFGKLTRYGTPAISFIIGGALASVSLALNFVDGLIVAFEFLILLATVTAILPVAMSAASAWLFAVREPSVSKVGHMRDTVVAAVGFAYAVWVIAGSGRDSVYWALLLLLAGVPIYVWVTAQRRDQVSVKDN